jgi:hypothetical protein
MDLMCRTRRLTVTTTAAVCSLVLLAAALCLACSDLYKSTYATMAAARHADAEN